MSLAVEIRRALSAYAAVTEEAAVSRIAGGLIHQSFSVSEGGVEYVLQRVNSIFRPEIHENIAAVTEHLDAKGFATLRLVPTKGGGHYLDLGDAGIWRLMTRVPGRVFETCASVERAHSAGALVASFHSALGDLAYEFQPLGFPFHDTAAHFADLEKAVERHRGHRLYADVAALAEEIRAAAADFEASRPLPRRAVHGDLKFNNILFQGNGAASLIDLDTLSRLPLWIELGDAWRSWCNRAGEDNPEAELDLHVFRASAEGYLGNLSLELQPDERRSLVTSVEHISLELSARFAADALQECYFGWDSERFLSAGDHHLTRARGQLSLYRQARETRELRSRILLG